MSLIDLAKKWDNVEEAGTYKGVSIGVKPIKIIEVIDVPQESYIEVLFDIAAGPEKDFYANASQNSTWPFDAKFRKYYTEKSLPFFKSFITAIEKSNEGYSFQATNGDVTKLTGKIIYGVFEKQETTSVNNEGKPSVFVKLNTDLLRSKQAFIDGKIPEPTEDFVRELNDWGKNKFQENYKKWLDSGNSSSGVETKQEIIIDDDLPF